MRCGELVAAAVLVATLVAFAGCSDSEAPISPGVVPIEEAGVAVDGGGLDAGDGAAVATAGESGEPCTADTDCKGIAAECVHERNGVTYPGGSCTSKCDPAKNDVATQQNPDCPGTRSVCNERVGKCLRTCTEKAGANPCREGYSCYDDETAVCGPDAISQCQPSKVGQCGPDDAGPRACIKVGYDDVGLCVAGCDVFAQGCTEPGFACFPNAAGEGTCLTSVTSGTEGASCTYKNDCAAGLGCAPSGVCRPYCGGASNVACTNGKSCVDFDATIKKSLVGVCDG